MECARRLTGMRPRKRGGTWVYPKSADVLRAARLQPLKHYIQKRRATVAAAVGERPVLEACKGAERLRGSPVRTTWWELDLTLTPEPEEEEDDVAPGMGGSGPPRERQLPRQGTGTEPLEEQQALHRAKGMTLNLGAGGKQEQDRLWAQAHLPSDLI